MSAFDDLPQNAANYAPLTPLSFLERASEVYPGKPAVIHGEPGFGCNLVCQIAGADAIVLRSDFQRRIITRKQS